MSDLELAYLAGFFDGEGCVHINRPDRQGRMSLLIRVTQTDPAVLLTYEARWGGTIYSGDNGANRKTIWSWTAHSNVAAGVLRDLMPYLRVKVAQAELGIRFQELKIGENSLLALKKNHPRREEILSSRRQCHSALSVLNKRGR